VLPGLAEEALVRARQADGATGGRHPATLAVVADAYAATGRLPQALAAARQAQARAAAAGDAALAGYLADAVRRYEAALARPEEGENHKGETK
jgi:hypothetical protein